MSTETVWLLGSLVLLVVGAELLVRGATALALHFRLSPLFVGLTIVGFGTSSPELTTAVVAALRGQSDIAVGNVVGSNVFNIAVILGLAAVVRPIRVQFAAIRHDVVIGIVAATTPWLTLLTGGVVTRGLGLALIAGLGVYLAWGYREGRRAAAAEQATMEREIDAMLHIPAGDPAAGVRMLLAVASVAAGLGVLVTSARWFVGAAVEVAHLVGLSELTIGLTIVAAGTSMPELVTSTVAAIRGNSDIALGNVLGSNAFNLLGVLGASALVEPQVVASHVLRFDVPVMLAASAALLPIVRTGGVVSRLEGAILVAAYATYVGVLLARGA